MLQWPREIPIEGEPADVAAIITRNGEWLAKTPEVPKQLLTFDGTGPQQRTRRRRVGARHVPQARRRSLGSAGHHAPEDAPKEIAARSRAARSPSGRVTGDRASVKARDL